MGFTYYFVSVIGVFVIDIVKRIISAGLCLCLPDALIAESYEAIRQAMELSELI